MTATFAPSPWSAPAASRRDAEWRFGRAIEGAGMPTRWLWELRRNCSTTPRQMLVAYALLCALVLAVAAGFWWNGVQLVMAFAGIELLAVGIGLLVMARHAGDREVITVSGREMAVEQHVGPRVEHTRFRAEWVRVEPAAAEGSLVELSGEGRSIRIGRHVRPELRFELAQELRRALRLSRAAGDRPLDHELQA